MPENNMPDIIESQPAGGGYYNQRHLYRANAIIERAQR